MALISQNFKNDTKSNAISVEPIIVLADLDLENNKYIPVDIFSTFTTSIKDTDTNSHNIRPIIKSVSSIKSSVDYEKRKLKINTFRFNITNYHDMVTKLTNTKVYSNSQSGNALNNLIGKNVILYYKTQTTELLNLNNNLQSIEDNHHSIIFKGIINRIKQNKDTIDIQAEDFIQSYISDVPVPSTKISDLPEYIQNNTVESLDTPVPMVFGKVDFAPTISYVGNSYGSLSSSVAFIHDVKGIFSRHIIKKVQGQSYWHTDIGQNGMFVKDDDWLYFGKEDDFTLYTLTGQSYYGPNFDFEENTYLIPELQSANSGFPTLGLGFTFSTKAQIDTTGESDVRDIRNVHTEDLSNNQNTEFVTNNGGYSKKWYRSEDAYFNGPIDGGNFVFSQKNYPSSTEEGKGRWILLSLDSMKKLRAVYQNWQIKPSYDDETLTNSTDWKWYCIPFNYEAWKSYLSTTTLEEILEMGVAEANYGLYSDVTFAMSQNLTFGSTINTYWADFFNGVGSPTENIPRKFWSSNDIVANAFETDKVLMFEFYEPNNHDTINCGFKMYNFAFEYMQEIGHLPDEKVYASVIGRKDFSSTENMENVFNNVEFYDAPRPLSFFIEGKDGSLPDFETAVNIFNEYFEENTIIWTGGVVEGFVPYGSEFWSMGSTAWNLTFGNQSIFGLGNYEQFLPNYHIDGQGFVPENIFNVDDGLNRSLYVVGVVILGMYRKFLLNIIHKLVYEGEIIQSVGSALPELSNSQFDITPYYETGADHVNFADYINSNYQAERISFIRRILKFLYRNDLNEDTNSDNLFQNTHGAEPFTYEWNNWVMEDELSLHHVSALETFIQNLGTYLDDTLYTINTAIFDYHNEDATASRSSLYLWKDNGTNGTWASLFIGEMSNYPLYDTIIQNIIYSAFWEDYTPIQMQTDGIVQKPTDIILNILMKEMKYGIGNNSELINLSSFDVNSIEKAREIYIGWKMGFCIEEEINGKKLLEDILQETMSYLMFNSVGQFSMFTIGSSYTYNDIDYIIDENDVINFEFTKTKRENIVMQNKYFYRYDNGFEEYPHETEILKIEDLLPDYDGYNFYNIDEIVGYKERNLRYHTDTNTVLNYQRYELLNNCNQHLVVKLSLPLSYSFEVGNIIHIPLINNTKAFGIDYSKVELLNSQPIYPLWIITAIDIKLDRIVINAIQLHYLGTDGEHGFQFENEQLNIITNLREYNSTYPDIKNWNYVEQTNPNYTYEQGVEIPYGDITGEGLINVIDVFSTIGHVLGIVPLEGEALARIANYDFINNQIIQNGIVDVSKCVSLIDIILEDNE